MGVAVAAKEGLAMVVPGLAAIDEHCFVSAGFEDRAKSEKCAFGLRAGGNAFSGQVGVAGDDGAEAAGSAVADGEAFVHEDALRR